MLKGTATGIGATLVPFTYLRAGETQKKDNRTVEENRNRGTHEWQLQFTSFDTPVTMASYPMVRYLRSVAIEGYATKTSLLPKIAKHAGMDYATLCEEILASASTL